MKDEPLIMYVLTIQKIDKLLWYCRQKGIKYRILVVSKETKVTVLTFLYAAIRGMWIVRQRNSSGE